MESWHVHWRAGDADFADKSPLDSHPLDFLALDSAGAPVCIGTLVNERAAHDALAVLRHDGVAELSVWSRASGRWFSRIT